jgi:hypothetical protein
MSNGTRVKEAVQLVKRLQTFDLASEEGIAGLPKDVFDVEVKSETLPTGTELRTTTIRVSDPDALKALDVKKLQTHTSPEVAKVGALAKRIGAFNPKVLDEATNFLPAGMIAMNLDAARLAADNNAGINFQFRFMKLRNGEFWPVPLENIG